MIKNVVKDKWLKPGKKKYGFYATSELSYSVEVSDILIDIYVNGKNSEYGFLEDSIPDTVTKKEILQILKYYWEVYSKNHGAKNYQYIKKIKFIKNT